MKPEKKDKRVGCFWLARTMKKKPNAGVATDFFALGFVVTFIMAVVAGFSL